MKVTEIYGIKTSGSSNYANTKNNGGLNRRQSFRGQSITEETDEEDQDSGVPSTSGGRVTVYLPDDEDTEESEEVQCRDACCSPMKELLESPAESVLLRRSKPRWSAKEAGGGRAPTSWKRISAPPNWGPISSDSDGEGGKLFVPERRQRTLSEDASAYEAENSSTEEGV